MGLLPPPRQRDRARRAVTTLLPDDTETAGPYPGVNNDQSAKPNGTCQVIVYTSVTLASAVRSADPSWHDDPSKATATFYSGRATGENGSEKPVTPSTGNQVLISVGGGCLARRRVRLLTHRPPHGRGAFSRGD